MPPEVIEAKAAEERTLEGAKAWVREQLEDYFMMSAEAFSSRTAAEVRDDYLLVSCSPVSEHFAAIVARAGGYQQSYDIVNNELKRLVDIRLAVLGEPVTNRQRRESKTYKRPHNESDKWVINARGSADAVARAERALRKWLRLEGGDAVQGLRELHLSRVQPSKQTKGGVSATEPSQAVSQHAAKPVRRRRTTGPRAPR